MKYLYCFQKKRKICNINEHVDIDKIYYHQCKMCHKPNFRKNNNANTLICDECLIQVLHSVEVNKIEMVMTILELRNINPLADIF